MYWIALVTSGIFLLLLCLARREEAVPGTATLLVPFCKIAMYLYKKLCCRFPRLFASPQVEKDLIQLHPGESREFLKTEYYVRKAGICMAVVLTGTLFGAAAKFSAESKVILREDGTVTRGSYREEAREIRVGTDYGEQQMDFDVEVEPKRLPDREAEALCEELVEKLPEYIAGGNESLQNVTSNLALKGKYEDYPISVQWESDKPGFLSDAGQVFSVEEAVQVTLTAHLAYDGFERSEELEVTLRPPALSQESLLYLELEEMLRQSQNSSLDEDEWRLPSEWKGERVVWRQVVEDNSLLLWGAALATAVAVFLFLDRDLHEQLEKRKRGLRRDYPEIVHRLVLFVGAGMTIRGAFQRIAGDYEAKFRNGGRASPAYEEMLYTCRELRSGISEGLSYERFGRRTGLQEYVRLCALLTQNLKRGNSTLLERLREEAEKSAQERLQQSKKLGEEAGTKLLVPMVMMLAVIMVIIMIPAFSTM